MSDPKSPVSRHGLGGGLAARQAEVTDLDAYRQRQSRVAAEDRALLASIDALALNHLPCDLLTAGGVVEQAKRWWISRPSIEDARLARLYVEVVHTENEATAARWLLACAAWLRKAGVK